MGMLEDFEKFKRDRSATADQDKGDLGFAIWEAASLSAAEKVKEEAARVCRMYDYARFSEECVEAIRAIDMKKLLEHGGV